MESTRRKRPHAGRKRPGASSKATNKIGTTARYRSTDPSTSREAAAFVSDHLPNLENVVFGAVKRAKKRGMTLSELIEALGLDKVTISPRLRPLAEKGLIFASSERRMGKSGRNQTVWKCVEWMTKEDRANAAA